MLQQISYFFFLLLFFSFFLYSCDGNVLLSADASENITFDANTRLFTTRVNLDSVIKTIDDRFLSLTLDTSIIRHDWAHFDTSSVKLKTLAKGLSPVYLRLGGTSCDFLIFRDTEELGKKIDFVNNDAPDWEDLERPVTTKFNMTMFDWVYLNKFVRSVPDWLLVFDLNVLQRTNNSWDPSINASSLLHQSAAKGYCLAGLELGNEPDAFHHLLGYSIDPTVLGKDFRRLSKFKSQVPCMGQSLVIGPDVTAQTMRKRRHEQFLKKFLQEAHASLDAVTIHHYYVNGRKATADQFMDPYILDSFQDELDVAFSILEETSPGKPLWLGETSSAFGGGSVGLSDTYIAGFMWMDKLGISARKGVKVVMRQSFYKGHYALLDFRTLDPRPDYWLSLLFKRLVGNTVLDLSINDQERKVRMYAHCTQWHRNSSYTNHSLTIYGMNLYEEDIQLKLSQFASDQELHIYKLEPRGPDGIFSQSVNLNGRHLKLLDGNEELPSLRPHVQNSNIVKLSPRSLVFIVIPKVDVPACKSLELVSIPKIPETHHVNQSRWHVVKEFLHFFKCLIFKFFYILF